MSSVDEAEATDAPREARTGGSVPLIDRAPRAAAVVFAVVVAIAFVLYLRAGRDEWFYLDEWDFLGDAGRRRRRWPLAVPQRALDNLADTRRTG